MHLPAGRALSATGEALRRQLWKTTGTYIYTYPTKTAYLPTTVSPGYNNAAAAAALSRSVEGAWAAHDGPLNLYVHIPFCRMKCSFCSLFTTTAVRPDEPARYAAALVSEMRAAASRMPAPARARVETLHFGGGTPTTMPASVMGAVVDAAASLFDMSSVREVSIEAAPSTVSREYLSGLRAAGLNGISFGVQSFHEGDLKDLGRSVDKGKSVAAVEGAHAAGFQNVTVDLINGLPGHTLAAFEENVRTAVRLGAITMQVYPLEIRARTKYGRALERERLAHTEASWDAHEEARVTAELARSHEWQARCVSMLEEAGYEWNNLPTFSLRGSKGRNWQEEMEFSGVPTLGLGAGARTYAPGMHYCSDNYYTPELPASIISKWYENAGAGRPSAQCGVVLTDAQIARRLLALAFLTDHGCARGVEYAERAGVAHLVAALGETGLVDAAAPRGMLRLTREGLALSSQIGHLFFEPSLEAAATGSRYYSAHEVAGSHRAAAKARATA